MINKIILDSIRTINSELKNPNLNNPNIDTLLFENLDSISVLNIILEVEDRLQSHYGRYIQIADDTMMDVIKTPFKTVLLLEEFLKNKIEE